MIFYFLMLIIQQQFLLNPNASDSYSVQLENYLTLYDSEDYIFYKATMSTISADNSIFVYSNGSDHIYRFAANGNLLNKRKVQGSGPGEISTPVINIFTIENRLIIQDVIKLHIYDNNLKLITDVRLMVKGQVGQSIRRDNDILIVYPTLNNAFQLYDKNGTLLKSSIPEKYEVLNAYGFNGGDSFHFYNNHYIKRSKRKYAINIYDENFNLTTSIVKD